VTIDALLDSNVVIAMLAEAHEHHRPSLALFDEPSHPSFAIAAHSYAEIYSTLTRRGERAPFHFTAEEAWAALESVRAVTALIGLTAAQTFDTVRKFAQTGGIGARLYDRLIGEVALIQGISMIVTWNIGHMSSLFPGLRVVTPHHLVVPDGGR
jgi:predicted nucleic acid-binding protein